MIQTRTERDPAFREELLKEEVERLLPGDVDTGKTVLRDCIKETIGFLEPGGLTEKSPKSVMRMFGPNGNPQARNLFEGIGCMQEREGVHLKVLTVRQEAYNVAIHDRKDGGFLDRGLAIHPVGEDVSWQTRFQWTIGFDSGS